MTTAPVCADCSAPGFVVTPSTPGKPALVLCADCYAARWQAGRERAMREEGK